MNERTEGPLRHRLAVGLTIVALGLVGAAVGSTLSARGTDTQPERIVPPPKTQAPPRKTSVASAPTTTRRQMPNPVRVSIPAIGVNARVVALGLNADGTMEVPTNRADAGWFQPGPEPGEQGAAVIVGHVAMRSGPGVFYRLHELRVGQVITVRLHDGSAVRYVARSMLRVSKSHFPTDRVYARTKQPTLRLITCAGKLNPVTGHHPDNYIVFATILR